MPPHNGIVHDEATAAAEAAQIAAGNINIALAFGLVSLACFFSVIGSVSPLLLPASYSNSPIVLAASLSLSAGVLLFLALGDILPDATESFKASSFLDPANAHSVALAFFVAGITVLVYLSNLDLVQVSCSKVFKETCCC